MRCSRCVLSDNTPNIVFDQKGSVTIAIRIKSFIIKERMNSSKHWTPFADRTASTTAWWGLVEGEIAVMFC